jgi:hypothetical protein
MATKILSFALLFSVATVAYAAKANWTGNQRDVQTVTGQSGRACEYDYFGTKFWRTFVNQNCPYTVEVQ